MRHFVSYYALSIKLAFYIALLFAIVAGVIVVRSRDLAHAIRPLSRLLTVGSAVVIFVATGLPRDWPPDWGGGKLRLVPGHGGFDWRDLVYEPNTVTSLLIVLNVLLYIPLGFFGALGWRYRPRRVFLACVALSVLIEIAQLVVLNGYAATDDLILNTAGAAVGVLLGVWFRRRTAGMPG